MTAKNPPEVILALDYFIANSCIAESMTDAETKNALESSLVETIANDKTWTNGIKVTENGYFLTVFHTFTGPDSNLELRMSDGSSYPIKEVCAFNRSCDLALAKADVPGECKAVKYKFLASELLDINMPVSLLARDNGNDYQKSGQITHLANDIVMPDYSGNPCCYPDNFIVDIPVVAGDSGGIAASQDYRIMGLMNAGDQVTMGMAARWNHALELIDFYKKSIESFE